MNEDIRSYDINLTESLQECENEELCEEVSRRLNQYEFTYNLYGKSLQKVIIDLKSQNKEDDIITVKIAISELQDVYDLIHQKGSLNEVNIEDLNM